jgi:hypothetical protein
MSIVAKNSSESFTPAPADRNQAVCVDVIDLGMVERENKGKKSRRHEIRIVFQIAARMENGCRFVVTSKPYGLSLHPNSALRPFLESWRGQPFTDEQARAGLQVERLIGANALLTVVHAAAGGNTYANIGSILPWKLHWGQKLLPENYTRKPERQPQQPVQSFSQTVYQAQPHQQPSPQNLYQMPVLPQGVQENDIPF